MVIYGFSFPTVCRPTQARGVGNLLILGAAIVIAANCLHWDIIHLSNRAVYGPVDVASNQ